MVTNLSVSYLPPISKTQYAPCQLSPSAKRVLVLKSRVKEGSDRNNEVGRTEQSSFKVITAAIQDQEVDDEDRYKERNGFEQREVQRHRLSHTPAEKDNERRYEKRWT
jgi:hypothetical protein